MTRPEVPYAIRQLADARAAARKARDWATADRLRGEIEAAGWRVEDAGTLYILELAAPAAETVDGITRYGASATVPSRLDEPATGTASVVIIATDSPADVDRLLAALLRRAGGGLQVVVVANAPSDAQAAALADPPSGVEVVWLARRLGVAAAVNAGIRRATAEVVILMDAAVEPLGDLPGALAGALEDASVAVAGPFGRVSDDLRRFADAPPDGTDVDAITSDALAFRRADYVAKGPLDEHFTISAYLDTWWSLVLRDFAEDDPDDALPRRAVQVAGAAAMVRHRPEPSTSLPAPDERQVKKNFYRFLKRFATRRDLLVGAADGASRS